MSRPAAHIDAMRAGEEFFLAQVSRLDDAALDDPSLLQGWSRRHLIAHVARNADALRNLFTWARTGIETPMYASPAERADGIETTARLGAPELRIDLRGASDGLIIEADSLPEDAWDRHVRTARGREIIAADIPWMRIRESWIHGVDLAGGASFCDLPDDVMAELLADVCGGFRGRDDCAAMTLRDRETGEEHRIGAANTDIIVVVEGLRADLLAWLLGRDGGGSLTSTGADERPPAPPAWL